MSKNSRNRNNIKANVLSDVLNWKTSEKSYEDLCKRFGDDVISKEDHNLFFNLYIKEANDLARAQTNINEIIFNEAMYSRFLILQYVILKTSIFESYRTLCKTMRNISYSEFECWYYRFYNGQRDLDYDRSKDPKPLTFTDLPVDVIEKIVEKSEIKSRYILRKVSRGLRRVIDSSKLTIKNISILVDRILFSINVDGVTKTFYCRTSGWPIFPKKKFRNGMNEVCRRLSVFIKNSKLQLRTLDIKLFYDIELNEMLFELFESLSHQLHVDNLYLTVNRQQKLFEFILYMKPKILKKLEIGYRSTETLFIDDIVNSEQWKNAEEMCLYNTVSSGIAHFFHFKRFDIFLRMDSMESIIELKDGISKSSNFEWCLIRHRTGPSDEEIQRSLALKKHVHDEKEYFVCNIPNSTETLVFSFLDHFSHRAIFIKKSNCVASF